MYDPVMRVLAVLELLQGHDSVTGAELARRLEVDLRTVQRYIVRLKDLKIPVQSSPGVGGAYRLKPGYRLPPLLLSNEEAFALSLGLTALQQLGLSAFAPATSSTLAKLSRVLPDALRDSIRTVGDVVAIEPGPWVVTTSAESLICAASAIRMNRRVSFAYQSHDGSGSRRQLEPYAVVHIDGRWYLVGHCLTRKALRTFRLDRVSSLQMEAARFKRPERFNAVEHLRQSMPFVESKFQVDVWINMPLEEAAQKFMPLRVRIEAEGDGTRVRCGRDHLEIMAAMLLSMERRVIVHGPAELRKTFRKLARQALRIANDQPAKTASRRTKLTAQIN